MAILKKIIKCNQYDILTSNAKIGQMYFTVDTRLLYKDFGNNKEQRLRFDAVILHTESERKTAIKPVVGKFYYVEESNSLWFYDTRWNCKIGSNVEYNTYYSDDYISPIISTDTSITGINGDKILDNNGLLGDGSVVVRDSNRIMRSLIKSDTMYNQILINSYLDNGFLFIPNAHLPYSNMSTSLGAFHLTVEKQLSSINENQLELKGAAYYYGDFNIYGSSNLVKKVSESVSIDEFPINNYELIKYYLKCSKTTENGNVITTHISIKPMSATKALVHLISTNDYNLNSVVKNDMGELIFTNSGSLIHNVVLECNRRCTRTDSEIICTYCLDVSADLTYSSLIGTIILKQNIGSDNIKGKISNEWSDIEEVTVDSQKWIKDTVITIHEVEDIIDKKLNSIKQQIENFHSNL